MSFLLIFSCLLLLAVLLSQLAERSVLSSAVLFLAAGFLCGRDVSGLLHLEPHSPEVDLLAQLALFSVLFSDGMRVRMPALAEVWRLPGRALILGMPLTFLAIALAARFALRLDWRQSFLVGAVLSPTDPVFASAILGREEIPYRVRQLLNVESGLNDGLALPVVMFVLGWAGENQPPLARLLAELFGGVALGGAVAFAAAWLEYRPIFNVSHAHRPLFGFAVATMIFSLAGVTGVNQYLAAFAGGVVLGHVHPSLRDAFTGSGERLIELLKLAAVLAFGALISPGMLREMPWRGYLFAVLVLVLARSVALALALCFSPLGWRERLVAGWFGPKGFASVVYGIIVLKSTVPDARFLFQLIALVVAASIVAHSSSDVVFARWFEAGHAKATENPE